MPARALRSRIERRRDWRARLATARAEAAARLRAERAAAAGLTEAEYRRALSTAFQVWSGRHPWRWLPAGARGAVWDLFGGPFAHRFVVAWGGDHG